jgi:branched-chain amino acid transport system substrate-binding protein
LYKATKRLGLLAVIAGGAVAITGCGSSSSSSSASTSSTTAGTSSGISAASVQAALAVTSGKAGAADAAKSPVTVGFITDNGVAGLQGEPFVNAMQAAVGFINGNLGGIDGHPLRVKSCQITQSAQQGTVCAQAILNDPAVNSFVTGADSFGDTEILNTIAGKKPMFTAISSGPSDAAAHHVFGFNGGIIAAASMLTYVADQKPHRVSIIGPNDPVTSQIVGGWKEVLKGLGVSNITISLFSLGSTDLTGPIVASGASHADLVMLAVTNTAPCITVAKALQSIGISKPTVALGNCADPAVKAALGDLPHWTYFYAYKNTLAPDPSGQVTAYQQAVQKYANVSLANTNFAPTVFATFIDLAAVLNKAGATASPAQIEAATKAFTGPAFLGPSRLQFGSPPFAGLGTAAGRLYNYEGGGTWADAANGAWIDPPHIP